MQAYLELTKPRITWLILMSTAIGFVFGLSANASAAFSGWTLFHALLGTALIASGTAALNQWYESEADAKMHRTRQRPIPSGRVARGPAFWFALTLSITGFAELYALVNPLTAWLGLFTLSTYIFLYTPLKQRSPHSTTIGALPGAMPPLIGFAASAGFVDWSAMALFAILFVWQFPHFYAIAWMYREDYGRAGIQMVPVVEPAGESTSRRILFFLVMLLPVSILPSLLGMTGTVYLAGALALGFYFLRSGVQVFRDRSLLNARAVLLASVLYLPALYGLMLLDRA